VVIPKSLAEEVDLTEGTPVEISAGAGGIVLRKKGRRPRRPLADIVAQIKPGDYRRHSREMSADRPVGREIW